MSDMRICHVCNGFPPTVGGSETHNYSVVKYLAEKGYRVDVVVVRPNRNLLQRTNYTVDAIKTLLSKSYTLPDLPGVTVHNIAPTAIKLYYDLARKIKELEKESPIDIIDIHSYIYALAFSKKRKILLSLHCYELSCPATLYLPCEKPSLARCRKCCSLPKYLYWKVARALALSRISKFMVKYDYLKRKLVDSGVDESSVVVIPHWIDVEKINRASREAGRAEMNIEKGAKIFSFVGRLSQFNGPFLALEAFKKVYASHPEARLFFVGDGELKQSIERFCADNGFEDRVQLLGRLPHEKLLGILPSFDYHLLCSEYDNYNWTLLELMSSGKPIVATDVAGMTDILQDGRNALLAGANADSIADRMIELLEKPDLGARLAESALNTVRERHSMDNLQLYEELLESLVAQDNEN
ncbi:glycosyltransferase family 4 protein [Chloroflexota bacterium]